MSECALVTGASRGIGRAITEELLEQGWQVIGVARSEEKLQEIAHERFLGMVCDVSDPEQVKRVSGTLREKGIHPRVFFLNAGMAGRVAAEDPAEFSVAKHRAVMDVNYFGVLHWFENWQYHLQPEQTTQFVVISSVNAFFAGNCAGAYGASKAAISKAFQGLRFTYADAPLKFQVVYPGPVNTEGVNRAMPYTWEADRMAKWIVKHSLKGKEEMEPSRFYSIITRILSNVSTKTAQRILSRT